MSEFRVNVDRLSNNVSEIYRFSGLCNDYSSEIGSLDLSCLSDNLAARVGLTRNILSENLSQIGKHFYRLSYGLDEISNRYRETENGLLGTSDNIPSIGEDELSELSEKMREFFERLKKFFEKMFPDSYKVENIVFDDEGLYGGDQGQGNNLDQYKQMKILDDIGVPKEEIDSVTASAFFKDFSSEGCGYIAMSNIIFQQYIDREEDFENDFGFPMIKDFGDGDDLNYITLAAYLYYNYDDPKRHGTYPEDRELILEEVLGSCGIDVKIYDYDQLDKGYIKESLENGNEVLISVNNKESNYYSFNEATGEYEEYSTGTERHVMEITGVTADGYYSVSTWGQNLYIKPEDFTGSTVTYEVVND